MISAAIVGLGWWGRHIVASLNGNDKLRITRGVEPRLDVLNLLPSDAQFPITSSLDDALRDDEIDAIVLATPHSTHEEQIIRSAQAGKHVFAEKPLTLTRGSAERAINACDRAGVVLGIGHERRFEPAMEAIKELVRSESLGTLMHVESNFSHDLLANVAPRIGGRHLQNPLSLRLALWASILQMPISTCLVLFAKSSLKLASATVVGDQAIRFRCSSSSRAG